MPEKIFVSTVRGDVIGHAGVAGASDDGAILAGWLPGKLVLSAIFPRLEAIPTPIGEGGVTTACHW